MISHSVYKQRIARLGLKLLILTLFAVLITVDARSQQWLIKPAVTKSIVYKSGDGKEVVLTNGLFKREFYVGQNVACTSYENVTTGKQLIRSVKPEAMLTIDGKIYNIGGLIGQTENAYIIPADVETYRSKPGDFHFLNYTVSTLKPFLNWKARFWMPQVRPATGKVVSFHYTPTAPELKGLKVDVNYELYDGIPLMVKYVVVHNNAGKVFKLNRVTNEILGMVEEEGAIGFDLERNARPQGLYVESNYAFNDAFAYPYSDQTMHWKADSSYKTKVGGWDNAPDLLEVYEGKAPGIELHAGENFTSVRTHELMMDSYDREARGLAIRKMYATVAPWVLENPIFMHVVSQTDKDVINAIDQCHDTGYEALIVSFGANLDMEDTSAANLKRWKAIADYAHAKNVKIGCYALFSSRQISDADDVIDPRTGKPGGAQFGHAPCFGSAWGLGFSDKVKAFFTATGFDIFENDGPYPGDVCASTSHPGHKGLDDSQWRQWQIQTELYHWLNARGIYINSPDWYFLDGSNKIAMGYREANFSLPRAEQKILNRQNIYDATWEKTPSMGWGFVPLTEYQGGGAAATLEPLSEHLNDYEQLMMQYYGAGIQACYRGPRLYDTEETKQLVIRVISWYKKYREILNSDIIHLRRADGRDWDGILHVNPVFKEKGLAMFFNPTKERMVRHIKLPLYYSGLTTYAKIREKDGPVKSYKLNRDYTVDLTISIPPETYTWYVISS